jgi:6-pyruvoyltetrahydropterin/6-carboxytetrahydropterin synthase
MLQFVRVTKEFSFEMAHALWNYDGACRNIHGHSYKLSITVKGNPVSDESNPKLGMVIDFGDLKAIVKSEIINVFDHALVVNSKAPIVMLQNVEQMFEKYYILDYQPTCENLVIDFAFRIRKRLPETCSLFSVKLAETANSYAEWYGNDNE